MSKIPNIPTNIISLDAHSKQKNKFAEVEANNFDALMLTADLKANAKFPGFLDEFLDKITTASNDDYDSLVTGSDSSSSTFPFSPAFQATFGTTGPLPSFINLISSQLKLSAEQNRAFQEIAVRNKDATKTPENVQKIAMELRKAGIGN